MTDVVLDAATRKVVAKAILDGDVSRALRLLVAVGVDIRDELRSPEAKRKARQRAGQPAGQRRDNVPDSDRTTGGTTSGQSDGQRPDVSPSSPSDSPISQDLSLSSSSLGSSSSKASSGELGPSLEGAGATGWPKRGAELPETFGEHALHELELWAFTAKVPKPTDAQAREFLALVRGETESPSVPPIASPFQLLERFKLWLMSKRNRAESRRGTNGKHVQSFDPTAPWMREGYGEIDMRKGTR